MLNLEGNVLSYKEKTEVEMEIEAIKVELCRGMKEKERDNINKNYYCSKFAQIIFM